MDVKPTIIPDIKVIFPRIFDDERGSFSETYKKWVLEEAGIVVEFIQDNRSHSVRPFTVRGLHYQLAPEAQAKLVSVQRGRIYDVAVDLRLSSPTFGRHVGVELSAEKGEQIFIPVGFAHGFCTLEPDTVVTYKVGGRYAPSLERGLHWLTPAFDIAWPCDPAVAQLSAKDARLPDRVDPDACFP